MIRRALVLTPLLVALTLGRLSGQTGSDLIAQGLAAYRALDYDAAVTLLRRGLGANGTTLSDSVRSDAYAYLGASELLRGRRDPADAAFRQALATEPRFRPDSLIFPPQVTDVFDEVRRQTAYVRIRAPKDTTITYGVDQYVVRLYASARHEGTVDIGPEAGRAARRLFAGPIPDSLDVRWEGTDGSGRAPLTGALALFVTSRPAGGGPPRVVRLPITVRSLRRDTLPVPERPAATPVVQQPARKPSNRAVGTLAAGVLAGLAAVMLPEVVAADGAGGSARYYVGGGLALAGLVGFAAQQGGSSRQPAAVSNDQAARDAWLRRADSVRSENVRIRRDVRLRITSGAVAGGARTGPEGGTP
ncbi:MAG: hypothetical protein ACRENB_01465 [Gemmatimonadales bacterium]